MFPHSRLHRLTFAGSGDPLIAIIEEAHPPFLLRAAIRRPIDDGSQLWCNS
jgi:hypothetical protein